MVHDEPKSVQGRRTLPLDASMVAAARRLHWAMAAERRAAGTAYRSRCSDRRKVHVVVDGLGEPVHLESYPDRLGVPNPASRLT